MIKVDPRARMHADRAGEPLDGLVNMFDIGIVLAVGFLIAALHAVSLTTKVLTHKPTATPVAHTTPAKSSPKVVVKHNQKVEHVSKPGTKTVHVKSGKPVGQVYQLPNGQYVLVRKK